MIDISKGLLLYNNSEFFEAHKYFEDIWKENPDNRLFYQALVQISVGAYHINKGARRPAIGQYEKALKKMKSFCPDFSGLNVDTIVKDIEVILKFLHNSEHDITDIVKYIPKIEFLS